MHDELDLRFQHDARWLAGAVLFFTALHLLAVALGKVWTSASDSVISRHDLASIFLTATVMILACFMVLGALYESRAFLWQVALVIILGLQLGVGGSAPILVTLDVLAIGCALVALIAVRASVKTGKQS
ncbi:MAG: hypothetical protein R3A46_13730 [Thermomicrobiales bacterium]